MVAVHKGVGGLLKMSKGKCLSACANVSLIVGKQSDFVYGCMTVWIFKVCLFISF